MANEIKQKFAVIVNGSGSLVYAMSHADAIKKTISEYEKNNISIISEIKAYHLPVEIGKD